MALAVGYQIDAPLIECIVEHRTEIGELFFAWEEIPNGRNPFTMRADCTPNEARERLTNDLARLRNAGVALNLLLNGNCYGAAVLSSEFHEHLYRAIDLLHNQFGLATVTTASHFLAELVKRRYADIHTRASVNIRIGTTQGMEQVAHVFDGFCMQREYNRSLEHIHHLRDWCNEHGKTLHLLANSGCMNFCASQVFHDNLVAHEGDLTRDKDVVPFVSLCSQYLSEPSHAISLVRDSSWVRPEDIGLYTTLFDTIKLATRATARPARTVSAYLTQSYRGNVLDLLEPNHASRLAPKILANDRFPADFGTTVLACNKACRDCGYCTTVLDDALIDLSQYY